MRFIDILQPPLMQWTRSIVPVFIILCSAHVTVSLFQPGNTYTYSYNAVSSSGVLLPSGAASSWGLYGKLVIQAEKDSAVMQLQSLKTNMWNGKLDEDGTYVDINDDVSELLSPFKVSYRLGLAQNFSVEAEPVWITNMKRSIGGIIQLDLVGLGKQVAFHAMEKNHYGECNIEYVVSKEDDEQKLIRKSFDPRICTGHPDRTWSNVPKMQCPNNDQNPILKSSERQYKVRPSLSNAYEITFINATGGIYVQPFQSHGEAQFYFSRQTFELISVEKSVNVLSINNPRTVSLQHELPEGDLTQGRGVSDKAVLFKRIANLLDRLSHRLENPGLDTDINNLHNTTISILLYYLGMLDRGDLQAAYNNISGTSYKEETVRNMFLEALPQIGSKEAALFILELIKSEKVSEITAIQLLTQLPFHIRKPDVQLLVNLQSLLNLPEKVYPEVQNTAILTFGTLIYKTCLLYCPYEMLDDYVHLYLDKFTETTQYEKKMVWLEGLANIQLGRVVEFLEPIASGNNAESRHFRVLAAWASLPTAPLRPDVIYPVYWPILVNRTEHLEMRVAALTLLIVSNPTPNRLISLYWYMQSEPCQHLYNYFYTALKSIERTTHPCYIHIGGLAAQFTRVLRGPSRNYQLLTGNYIFDYQDIYRKFGTMIHGILIANPLTNIPEVMYFTLNNYGSGVNINQISLYIKAEGLLHSLSTYVNIPTQVKDVLKNFKLDAKQNAPVHLEVIARIQQKTILCLHLNQTNISKAVKFLSSLPDNFYHMYKNMEFHVNQQRINVPLTMESVQATDLGTNTRLAVTGTSLFSMRGNFTYTSYGRNNHVILRTSIHGTEMIENYNPLIDVWHSAERAQSIHGYLPINVTVGIEERPFVSYNTVGEHFKTGVIAHVRTATHIRGAKVASKLKEVCPNCQTLYIVTSSPTCETKTVNLFGVQLPELGGQLHLKVFDCETAITHDNFVSNVLSSHHANYQIWPATQFMLVGIHFLDYLSYVPPKGSCGLAAYIESFNDQKSQVKLEYMKLGNYHMLSLMHRALESFEILHQWNFAALYEVTSWISDNFKMKATRIIPGPKVLKLCLEAERDVPWEWDFLNIKPSDPSRIRLHFMWGLSDSAKGKCTGSSVDIDLLGEVSKEQIEDSKKLQWPYDHCREQMKGKNFVPYVDSCYEVSKELSTLRKYQIRFQYNDLPESLSKLTWRARALYDLLSGNSSESTASDQFTISALFPKDSNIGEVQLNNHRTSIIYDSDFLNYFLKRTRIHTYTDIPSLKSFFSICVLTKDHVRTVHNISLPFTKEREILLLGHCYDDNPRLALSATNGPSGTIISSTDESGMIVITPDKNGGAVFNSTGYIDIERNYVFHNFGSKRIRLDETSVDLLFPSMLLFMHWTQEQTLIFFPNYALEFSCGMCTADSNYRESFYERIH